MSWWVSLCGEDGDPLPVEAHREGGTYDLAGCEEADLNVTYNYGPHYYSALDAVSGIKWLRGKSGAETIERLERAVACLGVVRADNYWAETRGNAGFALSILLAWARQHPEGIWHVH